MKMKKMRRKKRRKKRTKAAAAAAKKTYGGWNKSQSANEDEVRFSALASMCLADDDLEGSQLCPGTPSSLARDEVISNQLSLYSSFLAFQAQHASSGHDKIIISAFQGWDRQRDPARDYARSKSRMAAFVYPEVIEPPSDDDSGPEENLIVPDAAEAPAVRTKKACSKGTSSTADQRHGQTSTSIAVVAGNPRFTWDVSEDHSPPATVPRPTPKSVGSN